MSFLTDGGWPPELITYFGLSREERPPYEARFYGAYNSLLSYCFGPNLHARFHIVPQSAPSISDPRAAVDFIVFVDIPNAHHRPVLFAEIKSDTWGVTPGQRLRADEQMRQRYHAMFHDNPVPPHLWGLSLLGTSLRVYRGDVNTGNITPPLPIGVRRSPRHLPPDFLQGAWSMDILSQEGFNQMKEIVQDILQSV